MHEMSIAQSMLDIVLEEARKHGASNIQKVVVKVGEMSGVVPHSLTFCFDLIKEDTMAAEAQLVCENVPLTGKCQECGAAVDLEDRVFTCKVCDSPKVEITGGQELFISHLEAE